jgi:hypothetical protein
MGRWFEPSRGFVHVAQFGRAMSESFRLLPCFLGKTNAECRRKTDTSHASLGVIHWRDPAVARLSLLPLYNGCRSEEILH